MELANMEASSRLDFADSEYDVFLSFRGADTRKNFVSHLYARLTEKGIHTFIDEKKLDRGEYISTSLFEAIGKSKVAIVVFSENYADSRWCMDELVKIVECKKTKGQLILPVFYKIDPSVVEEQTGNVAKAFQEHAKEFEDEEIQRWKKTLSEVATISGWNSQKSFDGGEAEVIKCIVREVSVKLNYATPPLNGLVGIDSHLSRIKMVLHFECADVRKIGIWGIGGIGKTTIANSIFRKYSGQFESKCFLEDVKDKHAKGGDTGLQKEFLNQILGGFGENIRTRDDGCDLIRNRLCHKKVLIVLDDVNDLKQLEALVNNLNWFGHGSRIIITTRDKHLLDVNEVRYIYEVKILNYSKSLELFSIHAFKQDRPKSNFQELSTGFVSYFQSLPLALKVLGTFLYGRNIHDWQSEFDKLKRFPNPDVYQLLKVSYDGLKDNFVKNVFLDIAFFFVRNFKVRQYILSGYNCKLTSTIGTLVDKALLTRHIGLLSMHDMIREMAHEIVREESRNPCKRSRLSDPKDVFLMLRSKKGTSRIEGISLDMSKGDEVICLESNTFDELYCLRILDFYMPKDCDKQVFQARGDRLDCLSPELIHFRWDWFPFKYWPSYFSGRNLVVLELSGSKLECLWDEEVDLGNLKLIDLKDSKSLKTFPNLSRAMNIEEIYFDGCESLVEFSSGLQHLKNVKVLSFEGCKKLEKLPMLPPHLQTLNLDGCGSLIEFSSNFQYLGELQHISFKGCKKLESLPMLPPNLFVSKSSLGFHGCENLIKFSSGLRHLKKVKELKFEGCKKLEILPTLPPNLSSLYLIDTGITELSREIRSLKRLQILEIKDCVKLTNLQLEARELLSLCELSIDGASIKELSESIGELKWLQTLRLIGLPITELPQSIFELKSLHTLMVKRVPLTELSESLVNLCRLYQMDISGCTELTRLPSSLHELPWLKKLWIRDCRSLRSLQHLPKSLIQLHADFCESLEALEADGLECLKRMESISFVDCKRILDQNACSEIFDLKNIETRIREPWRPNGPDRIQCVAPRNEILSWFQNKSDGSSITIELPSHPCQGVAFCVVYAVDGYPAVHDYASETISLNVHDIKYPYGANGELPIRSIGVDNNVLLWSPKYSLPSSIANNATAGTKVQLNFYAEERRWAEINVDLRKKKVNTKVKVKKCGVHFFQHPSNQQEQRCF